MLFLETMKRAIMANRNGEAVAAGDRIIRSDGNALLDSDCVGADERQTKLRLAHAINALIARRQLTQVTAADRLGIGQPKVSALANLKLDGFSVERLMVLLTVLDQDVEIVIRNKPRSRSSGRISVVATAEGR